MLGYVLKSISKSLRIKNASTTHEIVQIIACNKDIAQSAKAIFMRMFSLFHSLSLSLSLSLTFFLFFSCLSGNHSVVQRVNIFLLLSLLSLTTEGNDPDTTTPK